MDLWKNYGNSKHLKSFTCFTGSQAYSNLQLVTSSNGYFLACCYGNIIQTFGLDSFVCPSGDVENLETITLEDEQNLYHLKWLSSCSRENLLAIAGLESVSIHKPRNDPSHMTKVHHVINQHVTAMDGSGGHLAVAVSSLGDFKVRLYNLESGREEQQFKGHTSTIKCLNIEDSPQQSLVTGCHDKRVRVFDTRLPDPIMTLRGHGAPVSCVQMDDWKVASGSTDGLVCVWDQRLSRKLWDTHNRHPVKYLHFNNRSLITANIPNTKFPELYDNDDSSISARRDRGTISSYDFGTDQDNEAIPAICLSTYDQPDAYNYNIRLAVPYDNV